MRHFSEFIACLVTLALAECVRHESRSIVGEDAVLRCAAEPKSGVLYRSVIWYKVDEKPSQILTGLLRKQLTENKVEKYKGVEREVELLESSKSLLLSNVTAEDSGIYRCFLSAPLGHRNQQGEVILKVLEPLTADKMEFSRSDSIYVAEIVAFTVLGASLLMFCLSYVCLRNVFQNNKKRSLLKIPYQGKHLIIPNHLVCSTLPKVCV